MIKRLSYRLTISQVIVSLKLIRIYGINMGKGIVPFSATLIFSNLIQDLSLTTLLSKFFPSLASMRPNYFGLP